MKSFVIASVALSLSAAMAGTPSLFDKPKDTQVVKLPAEPVNPQAKPKRTCTYYPGFVVKEIDMGEVGAADMSITAIHGEAPKCERDITHEVNIDPETWSGYFKGAKGDFVFFDSGDGWNGGMPFAVFNGKTGRKLLSDTRKGDTYGAIEAADGTLTLRYRRVWLAPCSLMADAKGCWKKIVAVTSLAESARPDCAAAYHKEMERTPKFASDIPAMPAASSPSRRVRDRLNAGCRIDGGWRKPSKARAAGEGWLAKS